MTSLRTFAPALAAALTASAAALIVAANYAPAAAPAAPLPTIVFAPHMSEPPSPVADAIARLEARLSTPTTRPVAKPRTHVAAPAPVKTRTHVKVVPKPRTHVAPSPAPVIAAPAVEKSAPILPTGDSLFTLPTPSPSPTLHPCGPGNAGAVCSE